MKRKKTEAGFGAYEFLTVSVVCLILATILLLLTLNNINLERYQIFQYNAKIMALNAINIENETNQESVYLYQMQEQGLISAIKNPFSAKDGCDSYASKVVFKNSERYVTLQCGDYLIDNHRLTDEVTAIYHVGKWTTTKPKKSYETKTVYNLVIDGQKVLKEAEEEALFIAIVNQKLLENFQSVAEIGKEYPVKKQTMYREKTIIKKLKTSA